MVDEANRKRESFYEFQVALFFLFSSTFLKLYMNLLEK